MLRFFQPEVEVRRPFSAAPLDLRRASSLLQLPSWDSRVPRMQKDSVFPLPPSSSSSSLVSSLFGGSFAGNDQQPCMVSSNASGELERLLGGGFFINADDCDGFHLGAFSPPTSCIPTDTLNCNPAGIGDGLMTSRASADQQHTMARTRVVAEPRGEKETVMREAKRQKTTLCMKSQQPQPSDETTGSHSRVIKTPVRRSQKLGDKITALQQLVSPFGKTDTASVLHEATIYIKTLHEQIQMLTTPYFGIKSSAIQGIGGDELSLSQRGLCLSPISPTIINLANQTTLDRCTIERMARGPGVHFR